MGAWGTRIYEDDTALDIRGDFLDGYRIGTPIIELENSIKEEYYEDDTPEITDVAVLALACVELETGQLSNATKKAALKVIESGRQYEYWKKETSTTDAGLRRRELTRIKGYLENYDGKPVKRKSWTELQKDDSQDVDVDDDGDGDAKLDDVSWHMQDESEGLSEDDYYAYHAVSIACMMHWLVTRNQVASRLADQPDTAKYIEGKLTIFKYIENQIDGKFFATDIEAGPARNFVTAYYGGKFLDDIVEHIQKERQNYSFKVNRTEMEKLAKVVDNRFNEFKTNPQLFIAQNPTYSAKKSIPKMIKASLLLLVAILLFLLSIAILIWVVWFAAGHMIDAIKLMKP